MAVTACCSNRPAAASSSSPCRRWASLHGVCRRVRRIAAWPHVVGAGCLCGAPETTARELTAQNTPNARKCKLASRLVIRIKSLQYRCFTGKTWQTSTNHLQALWTLTAPPALPSSIATAACCWAVRARAWTSCWRPPATPKSSAPRCARCNHSNLTTRSRDMLITLGKQFHIIRPIKAAPGLFIYLVLDKSKSNLALARHKAAGVEAELKI